MPAPAINLGKATRNGSSGKAPRTNGATQRAAGFKQTEHALVTPREQQQAHGLVQDRMP